MHSSNEQGMKDTNYTTKRKTIYICKQLTCGALLMMMGTLSVKGSEIDDHRARANGHAFNLAVDVLSFPPSNVLRFRPTSVPLTVWR